MLWVQRIAAAVSRHPQALYNIEDPTTIAKYYAPGESPLLLHHSPHQHKERRSVSIHWEPAPLTRLPP